jgi:hypothetical protein
MVQNLGRYERQLWINRSVSIQPRDAAAAFKSGLASGFRRTSLGQVCWYSWDKTEWSLSGMACVSSGAFARPGE